MASRRIQTPTSTVNGNPAFPQLTIDDIAKIGQYAEDTTNLGIAAFIPNPQGPDVVYGGVLVLTGGLGFSIYPPLAVFRYTDGKPFNLMASTPQAFTLATADSTNPRIDLVYVTFGENIDAVQTTRHYSVDPTNQSAQQGDVSVYSEKWDQLTIAVATGTPASSPIAPALPNGAFLLYTITVQANATALDSGSLTDNRGVLLTLAQLNTLVAEMQSEINALQLANPFINADHVRVLPGAAQFSGLTAQDVFAILANQSSTTSFDPITRPETITSDGKVGAAPNTDNSGNPVIDIPAGIQVAFSNAVRAITVNNLPASMNPALTNVDVNAGTQSKTNSISPLGLGSVTSFTASGGGDWFQKNAHAPSGRSKAASAARDSQFIEVFGGQSRAGGNLSDWFTYDTQGDAVSVRSFTGAAPPACDHPAMFTCGDGVHVLIGCASVQSTLAPRWFLLNAVTGGCSEVFGGPVNAPSGYYQAFIGGLVQPGIIIILAQGYGNDNLGAIVRSVWKYDVVGGTFTQLNTSGQIPGTSAPSSVIDNIDACVYQQGQLVVFASNPAVGLSASGQTALFNYGSLQWTELAIGQPFNAGTANAGAFGLPSAGPITNGPKLRNFGGKIYLTGGYDQVGIQAFFWQLTPGTTPSWQMLAASVMPPYYWPGMASTLIGGLEMGTGFLITGTGNPPDGIWQLGQAGIIQTVYNGVTGITLAPGVHQASFTLADYGPLPWTVGTVHNTLSGFLPFAGAVTIQESFDAGAHELIVPQDTITPVPFAGTNSIRRITITLTSQGSVAPILTGITEVFEQVAGPQLNKLVIRCQCPPGTQGLYINRDGTMTLNTTISPTLPGTALLIKSTNNGLSTNPGVKNYRNKRVLMFKFAGLRATSAPVFDNDFGVAPTYVNATGITGGATVAVYKITDPVMTFDASITVNGLSNGDGYSITCFA